jgi:broad specificity phosphatase PhoE
MQDTILYLIRHAKSKGNVSNVFGGDPEITNEGKKQTLNLLKRIKCLKPVSIYSSDRIRTKQTAQILADKWQLPVIINKNIRERSYGSLDGKKILKKHKKFHDCLAARDPELIWDCQLTSDDETNRQAFKRFLKGLTSIAKVNIGKTSLVVTHGNVIRCLLVYYKIGSFAQLRSKSFVNTGYVKLGYYKESFSVLDVFGLDKRRV